MATLSVLERSFLNSVSDDRLQLILLPTERCNFRCSYCYEDFDVGRMPPDVISGVIRLLSKRAPSLRHLIVTLFGGEPLLAEAVMETISLHILELCGRYPGID